VAILLAALLVGALIAWPLRSVIRRAGLGFVDRFLGAVFGIARGVVFGAGICSVCRIDGAAQVQLVQNSVLAPVLVIGALTLAPWLPSEWAQRLDYSREARTLPRVPAERKV